MRCIVALWLLMSIKTIYCYMLSNVSPRKSYQKKTNETDCCSLDFYDSTCCSIFHMYVLVMSAQAFFIKMR